MALAGECELITPRRSASASGLLTGGLSSLEYTTVA